MFEAKRTSLYDFVYSLFYNVVTKNVYMMNEPQELTSDDVKNGFIVIRIGNINDESQFNGNAYAWSRVFIEAYVPAKSRGRIDMGKYKRFEDSINDVITQASQDGESDYTLALESVLSMDGEETSNSNNIFFMFIKSFIITATNQN